MAGKEIIGVRIKLATPERIREISSGEVKKPETINYRTLRPEKDGLFCERIFGPTKSYECACGKYKRSGPKFKGVICDRCGVEVTDNRVRRERMGHIELAVPVVHIWYLRGIPSRLSLLLGASTKDLEKVVSFAPTRKKETLWKVTAQGSRPDLVKVGDVISESEMEIHMHYDSANGFRAEEAYMIENVVDEAPFSAGELISGSQVGSYKSKYGSDNFKAEPAFALTEEVEGLDMKVGDVIPVSKVDEYIELAGGNDVFERAKINGSDAFIVTGAIASRMPFAKNDVISESEYNTYKLEYPPERFKAMRLGTVVDDACHLVIEKGGSPFTPGESVIYERQKKLCEEYDDKFEAGIGAEGVQAMLDKINLDELADELREKIAESKGQTKHKYVKRLQVVEDFRKSESRPQSMILNVLPVIPPDLRPLVQLDGGRFATSDLNDLYRRVINRNNRLKKLQELHAPEIIIRNEKRMLQECVDALIDNGRVSKAVLGAGNRPLKSLTDLLRGKKGRFRQNLLGKRVDYSGRSVIVIGPQLKIYQCGLPKQMALELFKPFVIRRLVDSGTAPNVKSAKRIIERGREEIWGILEEIIKDHPVMLNRAPTLHRLGIQAFEPVLMEGKAIRLHPMVCTAFNADFDGDQMAVHVPLSIEAQAEARLLMLSANNLLSPASGRPVVTPTQDIVLGVYYLTDMRYGLKGEGMHFSSIEDLMSAFDHDTVHVNAAVWLKEDMSWKRRPQGRRKYLGANGEAVIVDSYEKVDAPENSTIFVETSAGRAIFNHRVVVDDLRYVNQQLGKGQIGSLLDDAYDKIKREQVVEMLDAIKSLGYHWAAKSGISFGVKAIIIPPEKAEITAKTQAEDAAAKENYEMGLLTYDEYLDQKGKMWGEATDGIANSVMSHMEHGNSVRMMVDSGARGSKGQMGQMAGIRGLMSDPTGKTIDYPITANFREGMNMLEYFISTHGARKGLADTALRTAKSGYLTRRLVDVAQDLIITEEDCGTNKGICIRPLMSEGRVMIGISKRIAGRTALNDITAPGETEPIVKKGEIITEALAKQIEKAGFEEVWVRSPLACGLKHGVCRKCYGNDLSSRDLVPIGEAVGVVAAQSIGEPGTQLTMRTFHTGGVKQSEDITQGLPRIEQLFEVRRPRKVALLAGVDGIIKEMPGDGRRKLIITADDGTEKVHAITSAHELREGLKEGDRVEKMTRLSDGSIEPQQLLEVSGIDAVQRMLVDEIQYVYHSQGVSINNKHIEVILRKVAPLNKVMIKEEGDTSFVAGDIVWLDEVEAIRDGIDADNRNFIAQDMEMLAGDVLKSIPNDKDLDELNGLINRPIDEDALKILLEPGKALGAVKILRSEEHGGGEMTMTIGKSMFRKLLAGQELAEPFENENGRLETGTILGSDEIKLITSGTPKIVKVFNRSLLEQTAKSEWLAEDVISDGEVLARRDTQLTPEQIDLIAAHHVGEIKVWRSIERMNLKEKFSDMLRNSAGIWEHTLKGAIDVNGSEINREDLPPSVDDNVIKKIADGDITAVITQDGFNTRQELLEKFLNSALKSKTVLDVNLNNINLELDIKELAHDLAVRLSDKDYLLSGNNNCEIVIRPHTTSKVETRALNQAITFARKLRKRPEFNPFIHGITKAALATDSFLSAASFQQTAQILARAAVRGQFDPLHGLKENVIIGHLVPAGTGAEAFRGVSSEADALNIDLSDEPAASPVASETFAESEPKAKEHKVKKRKYTKRDEKINVSIGDVFKA